MSSLKERHANVTFLFELMLFFDKKRILLLSKVKTMLFFNKKMKTYKIEQP